MLYLVISQDKNGLSIDDTYTHRENAIERADVLNKIMKSKKLDKMIKYMAYSYDLKAVNLDRIVANQEELV